MLNPQSLANQYGLDLAAVESIMADYVIDGDGPALVVSGTVRLAYESREHCEFSKDRLVRECLRQTQQDRELKLYGNDRRAHPSLYEAGEINVESREEAIQK